MWIRTIYEARIFRAYVNAAYLNGANFLEALNYRMGDDDFYRFLQDYTSRYGRGRATAATSSPWRARTQLPIFPI